MRVSQTTPSGTYQSDNNPLNGHALLESGPDSSGNVVAGANLQREFRGRISRTTTSLTNFNLCGSGQNMGNLYRAQGVAFIGGSIGDPVNAFGVYPPSSGDINLISQDDFADGTVGSNSLLPVSANNIAYVTLTTSPSVSKGRQYRLVLAVLARDWDTACVRCAM